MPASRVHMCCASVISQCLFFFMLVMPLQNFSLNLKFGRTEMEAIADHIAGFSLSAIKDVSKDYERREEMSGKFSARSAGEA